MAVQTVYRDRRPNILLVITDQQRFDTISAHVNNFAVNTPAMDTMARNGVLFSNAFTTCPICTPARAAMLTGCMPSQVGMPGNIGNPNPSLNFNITTLAHRMEQAGYTTVYHGKSHLGSDLATLGFKTCFENSLDETTRLRASEYWRNRDWIVLKRPFFHVLSFLDPHDIYFLDPDREEPVTLPPWPNHADTLKNKPWPQQAHGRGRQWSPQRWEYYRQFYRSRVEKVDRDIALSLEELVCGGFGNNTWVIFTTDHGDMSGEHGCAFKGPFMYDAQVHVPFIIMPPRLGYTGAWSTPPVPGFRPHVNDALVSHLDIAPTCLDIAGVAPDASLRGRSLLPLVRGETAEGHEAVFAEFEMGGKMVAPIRMVRTKKWKYTLYLGHGEELYDLEADPWETTNLAGKSDHARVQADLKARLMKMIKETDDPFFTLKPTDRDGNPFTTVPIEKPE